MRFIDRYFYAPTPFQKLLALLLLPISLLYLTASILRRRLSRYRDFHIPIISVGNLIAGGSGKTPFIMQIAKDYEGAAIILRGYKRKSKGLVVVSQWGEILVSQEAAGDEAYLIASKLPHATIIVCKKRALAIEKAKELGAKVIFLDDGFRFCYKKLNILLEPQLKPYYRFCLPSGIYRENPSLSVRADILVREGRDYEREVTLRDPTPHMLLVTAIANPTRLERYLPNVVGKITLPDHSSFDEALLREEMEKLGATSLLITQKDEVKMLDFNLPLSILELELKISPAILERIKAYIAQEQATSTP